ncbi:hypothetical protein D3C85_744380 [compost metagenome]
MLSTTVLPALALVTECPGRNDVFPFSPFRAALLFPGLIAARLSINPATRLTYPCPFAAAIQLAHGTVRLVEVDLLLGDDLGFGKGRWRA